MRIEITSLQNHYELKKSKIKRAINDVLVKEKKDAELSIVFVDNEEIRKLNERFIGINEVTDVLAFPLSEDRNVLSGEVVVSVEKALEIAGTRKLDLEGEIFLYLVHGILHLMGYDDTNEKDAEIMRKKEAEILAFLGYKKPEF